MEATQELFEITGIEVGHDEEGFIRAVVPAVVVPRSTWLRWVEEAIEKARHWATELLVTPVPVSNPEVLEAIRETARTMTHFPFMTWVHSDRGCGCLVGEYLVAQPEIDRAEAARANAGPDFVHRLVGEREDARFIEKLGLIIDSIVIARTRESRRTSPGIVSVAAVFKDEE